MVLLERLEKSKTAVTLLSKRSKLEIIDGANRGFVEQYVTVVKLAIDWFLNNFTRC